VTLPQRQRSHGCRNVWHVRRDGNLGVDMWTIFYSWMILVFDLNRDGTGWIFFPLVNNLTSTRYFTTPIILGCE
jgi:hypothetical protein